MKKIILTLAALLSAATVALAVPAYPGTYKYKQPDGTVIQLRNHGDEYYHWITDENGNTVEKGADGFYRVAFVSPSVHRSRYLMARTRNPYRARWSSYENPNPTNFGDRKVLCFIAEFQPEYEQQTVNGETQNVEIFDGKFVLDNPNQHFANMLNQSGYNYNGAIGSVADYFQDNSVDAQNQPQYRPQFDVYGPVTLSQSSSYYDTYGADDAILEAYEQLKDQISDINSYDTDNDGAIDMVLFYYPGYNQAEQGPEWTIWPHQATGNFGKLGDKNFTRYFCTSELRGNSGETGAGIGTTCHEFSHALGLPDMYDMDYGQNGQADFTTDIFDLMASGNYNDAGRRPPYLSALERNMLGWMPAPPKIETAANYVLEGVQNRQAYRIDSRMPGEYFLLECRNGSGWDSGINTANRGLLVYHVDKSDRIVGGGRTAAYLWENTNNINIYSDHPCYVLVPSYTPVSYYSQLVFPGRESVTTLEPEDWDGYSAGVKLTNIAFNGTQVSFSTALTIGKLVDGFVKDINGNPLPGAEVILSQTLYPFSAPGLLSTDVSTTADNDGYYFFELETGTPEYQIVTARMDGYIPLSVNLSATERFSRHNFDMMAQGQPIPATLKKYDDGSLWSANLDYNAAVAMCYTAAELSGMGAVGSTISDVSFASLTPMTDESKVYVVVDFDDEIVLRKDVTAQYVASSWVTVDLSNEHIVIPEGRDVYIGYGITGTPVQVYMSRMTEDNGGGQAVWDFLTDTDWSNCNFGAGYIFSFLISANLSIPIEENFATHGVSFIREENGVPHVVPASGKTVYATQWYLDGASLDGDPTPVSELSAGTHTYMVRLSFYDGTAERVYYEVTVE